MWHPDNDDLGAKRQLRGGLTLSPALGPVTSCSASSADTLSDLVTCPLSSIDGTLQSVGFWVKYM